MPHGVDSPTGQSARPCRSARHRRCRNVDQRRPSGLETAVELRLGEKCARQFENLVGPAQFLDLAFRGLVASTLGRAHTIGSPRSTASRLTQFSSVCGVQPIIGAIDSTAAHIDGCSLRCSRTRRTARSRTSGENLPGFLFTAPFFQELEPPQNPVRFSALGNDRCAPPAYATARANVSGRVFRRTAGQDSVEINTLQHHAA